MITIVSRWELQQMPPELELRMWRQLVNFGISRFIFVPRTDVLNTKVTQYNTMQEALTHVSPDNRVFLESTGAKGMYDLPPRDEDVTFILGNSTRHNLAHARLNELYRIQEPRTTNMYPTSAAAIALAYWVGQ